MQVLRLKIERQMIKTRKTKYQRNVIRSSVSSQEELKYSYMKYPCIFFNNFFQCRFEEVEIVFIEIVCRI